MSGHTTKYLFFQWLHIEIGWVVEWINLESAKIKFMLLKGSKLYYAVNFLQGAHKFQIDKIYHPG